MHKRTCTGGRRACVCRRSAGVHIHVCLLASMRGCLRSCVRAFVRAISCLRVWFVTRPVSPSPSLLPCLPPSHIKKQGFSAPYYAGIFKRVNWCTRTDAFTYNSSAAIHGKKNLAPYCASFFKRRLVLVRHTRQHVCADGLLSACTSA